MSIYCTSCTDDFSGYCRSTTLYRCEAILSLPQSPFPVDCTRTATFRSVVDLVSPGSHVHV